MTFSYRGVSCSLCGDLRNHLRRNVTFLMEVVARSSRRSDRSRMWWRCIFSMEVATLAKGNFR